MVQVGDILVECYELSLYVDDTLCDSVTLFADNGNKSRVLIKQSSKNGLDLLARGLELCSKSLKLSLSIGVECRDSSLDVGTCCCSSCCVTIDSVCNSVTLGLDNGNDSVERSVELVLDAAETILERTVDRRCRGNHLSSDVSSTQSDRAVDFAELRAQSLHASLSLCGQVGETCCCSSLDTCQTGLHLIHQISQSGVVTIVQVDEFCLQIVSLRTNQSVLKQICCVRDGSLDYTTLIVNSEGNSPGLTFHFTNSKNQLAILGLDSLHQTCKRSLSLGVKMHYCCCVSVESKHDVVAQCSKHIGSSTKTISDSI